MLEPSKVMEPAELLAFLFTTWPQVKKKQMRTWLKFQAVMVNGRPVTQFNHPLRRGDVVAIRSDRTEIPKTELPSGILIRFEDDEILVIDNPAGLPCVPERDGHGEAVLSVLSEALGLPPTSTATDAARCW